MLEYIFFGFYWLFCLVRAFMTGSFGEAQYGAFKNLDGLTLGFYASIVWLIVVGVTLGALGSILASVTEDKEKE